jgi:hypothetical protein
LRATPNRRSPEDLVLITSTPTPLGHQIRLVLPRETVAQLVALQARALAEGYRKPTYSDLISTAVSRLQPAELAALLAGTRR